MVTQRSQFTASLLSFLSVFIFTLTANVIFQPADAWAEDLSQRDASSETADASKDAKGKLSSAADGASGFFGGIFGWINGVTDSINKMWGMENGGGIATVVNGMFYLILIVGFLFIGKMVLNIFTDAVKGKNSVDERYQKPSFRKR